MQGLPPVDRTWDVSDWCTALRRLESEDLIPSIRFGSISFEYCAIVSISEFLTASGGVKAFVKVCVFNDVEVVFFRTFEQFLHEDHMVLETRAGGPLRQRADTAPPGRNRTVQVEGVSKTFFDTI